MKQSKENEDGTDSFPETSVYKYQYTIQLITTFSTYLKTPEYCHAHDSPLSRKYFHKMLQYYYLFILTPVLQAWVRRSN